VAAAIDRQARPAIRTMPYAWSNEDRAMSDKALNSLFTGLTAAGVVVLALILASDFGWAMADYRGTLRNLLVLLIFGALAIKYIREKDNRPHYRAFLLWAVVISIPMVTMGFLRDYWQNAWFQSTLFPATFAYVMVATLLGYVTLGVLFFRKIRQPK
jgi:hypothetical protein